MTKRPVLILQGRVLSSSMGSGSFPTLLVRPEFHTGDLSSAVEMANGVRQANGEVS